MRGDWAREHGFELVGEKEPCDIAVACGAHGAAVLASAPPPAGAWLVQDLDDRRGAIVPAQPWSSPLHPIAGARWIADLLGELRARPAPLIVRPGVDKAWLTPPERPPVTLDEPLRVLIVADDRDGAAPALAAAERMREARTITVLQDGASVGEIAADRVVGPLTRGETAALLHHTDVVVRLTREEALPLVALHAFHAGATCVVAPATGHDEVVEHGVNGLVTSFDDERGSARALDLLARDRRTLAFLRENALATARAWPSSTQAASMLALALRRIAAPPC